MSDRLLVLVRHGQSEWNLKNLFTGWKDPGLTEKGVAEANEAGRKLKAEGLSFDIAFTSVLTRAQHTLDLILTELGQTGLPVKKHLALNERDYGDLSGLNKDDARKKWGEEQVHVWRRERQAMIFAEGSATPRSSGSGWRSDRVCHSGSRPAGPSRNDREPLIASPPARLPSRASPACG